MNRCPTTIRIFRIFIIGIAISQIIGRLPLLERYMNKTVKPILLFLFLSAAVTGCGSAIGSAADAGTNPNSASSSAARSTATFTGKNSRVSVNGDLVQAKDGVLTVNGVAYGSVNEKSVVTYSVQGGKKTLSVDGTVREPARY